MHPSFDALYPGLDFDAPSSLLGGEAFLAQIYDAIRSSASPDGSNAYNTVLMVNFDEHGGTYDHVPPSPSPPPGPGASPGQMGFAFDRSGVRIPAIAISPWIPERTVVNDEYRNTSVLHTMRERWSLGAPFSFREAIAPSLGQVMSLDTPRAPEDWPNLVAQPVPAFDTKVVPADRPLGGLGQALFLGLLALAKESARLCPRSRPTGRRPEVRRQRS
jgi:phospholipase C